MNQIILLCFLALFAVYVEGSSLSQRLVQRQVGCGPVCMIYCPNGNVLDERGCPTCNCKPFGPKKRECGPVCMMWCEHGNVEDANGCPICKCKPAPQKRKVCATCRMYCPNGFKMGSDGCPLCECKE